MSWRGPAAALLVALGLSACALTPPAALPGERLSGRLAVKVDASGDTPARSETAGFELQGTPEDGRLNLVNPLGSVVAQARWSPGSVRLVLPSGERRFADMDSLTRELLGQGVPVAALFDWLRARPWAGAPSTANDGGFSQLGWNVDLARYDDGLIVAQRVAPPVVTVRAKLDR